LQNVVGNYYLAAGDAHGVANSDCFGVNRTRGLARNYVREIDKPTQVRGAVQDEGIASGLNWGRTVMLIV
jgi:hypothetical protein